MSTTKPYRVAVAAYNFRDAAGDIEYTVHLTKDEIYELVTSLMVQLQRHDILLGFISDRNRSEFVDIKITSEGIHKHTASPHLPSASEDVTS